MKYKYEALDPETFQQLAQAMIVSIHPNAQCLPVGQPDGGRDAFLMLRGRKGDGFVVFQVKFSRDPSAKDERDSIKELVKSEADKVRKLVSRGAKRYYLITNVRGTSHPDTGSIDSVNQELSRQFNIPSYAWWRDDLDARIDANTNIKWSYPDIIRGSDVLELLVKNALNVDAERRSAALQSYLAAQFHSDDEVKFKQVELRTKLTSLFVDLPISFKFKGTISEQLLSVHRNFDDDPEIINYIIDHGSNDLGLRSHETQGGPGLQAARFFLERPLGNRTLRMVLEGAPGQGKSTITQYVCQVNRIRLLDRSDLDAIPKEYRSLPIRLPFRVDLRDYASWVSGKNPFFGSGVDEIKLNSP